MAKKKKAKAAKKTSKALKKANKATKKKVAKKTISKAKKKTSKAPKKAKKVTNKKPAKKLSKKKVTTKTKKKSTNISKIKKISSKSKIQKTAKKKANETEISAETAPRVAKSEAQQKVGHKKPNSAVKIKFQEKEDILDAASELKSVKKEEKVVLTDAEGNRLCAIPTCDQTASVGEYCRLHYILNWKRISVRSKILKDGKLEKYIEELTSRYPMKYLEMLKKDLKSQQDFLAAVHELEIDDSSEDSEFEDDSQSFIDEVRGISSGPSSESDQDEDY